MALSRIGCRWATTLALMLAPPAPGQPAGPRPLLERRNPTDWTLHGELFLTPFADRGLGGVRFAGVFEINEGVVVFPLIAGASTSELRLLEATTELRVQQQVVDTEPTMLVNYQAGERMGRWDIPRVRADEVRLIMDLPVRCFEVTLDVARASALEWPVGDWPPTAVSALQPQQFVESDDAAVRALVQEWTNGQPRRMRPYDLAQFLAGRVIDHMQPSGEGFVTGRFGRFAGLDLAGAARTAQTGRGSPHDVAALLCAVYRAAGLPARVVVGFDVAQSMGRDAQIFNVGDNCGGHETRRASNVPILRTWVEFYLLDPANPRETTAPRDPPITGAVAVTRAEADASAIPDPGWWIPVDIVRLREFSSRALPTNQPWPWFGTNDCTDNLVPLSFHFHPPTTVAGGHPGSPALYGWLATPATPRADQHLLFRAMHTPVRAPQRR